MKNFIKLLEKNWKIKTGISFQLIAVVNYIEINLEDVNHYKKHFQPTTSII